MTKPCKRRGKAHCLGTITAEPRKCQRRIYCSRKCAQQETAERVAARRPRCQCGCGGRVKKPDHRYIGGHVPRSVRQAGGRKARAIVAFRQRRQRFDAVFTRMVSDGRKLTKEAILDAFTEIERAAYTRGWHACEAKVTGRTFSQTRTAA